MKSGLKTRVLSFLKVGDFINNILETSRKIIEPHLSSSTRDYFFLPYAMEESIPPGRKSYKTRIQMAEEEISIVCT